MSEDIKIKGQQNGLARAFAKPSSQHGDVSQRGLTKREWLAGIALPGICYVGGSTMSIGETATTAVQLADELLRELEK